MQLASRSWLLLAALPAMAQTGGIRGSVVDARGGEPLASVQVQLTGTPHRAVSGDKGEFQIDGVAPGDYVLSVSTVGYHVAKRPFRLEAGERKEFDVVLSADNLRQTDTVVERTDPFDTARQDSPSALVLAGNDARNLGSVLADDPLRAVQGLPGVTSNNDFDARFSLRGADYSRIGLYLDNVLLHAPFHMLAGTSGASGSGTTRRASATGAPAFWTCARATAAEPVRRFALRRARPMPTGWRRARSAPRNAGHGWSPRARAICNTFWSAHFPIRP